MSPVPRQDKGMHACGTREYKARSMSGQSKQIFTPGKEQGKSFLKNTVPAPRKYSDRPIAIICWYIGECFQGSWIYLTYRSITTDS
jgi:hypothetical protein